MLPVIAGILAMLGLGAGGVAASAINKRVQRKNIERGKPQGAFAEAAFGSEPGRVNKGGGGSGVQQFQNYTPDQTKLMNLLGGLGQKGVEGLIGQQQNSFDPIAKQAREQFNQQTVPGIAERFTQMGGGQRSSAFGQQLGSAGANLDTNLAALRSQHGFQQQRLQQDLYNNLLQLGLKPQFENAFLGNGGGGGGIGDALSGMIPKAGELVQGLVQNRNDKKSANAINADQWVDSSKNQVAQAVKGQFLGK